MVRSWLAVLGVLALLAGCSSAPLRGITRAIGTNAEKQLTAGIRSYEDGRYDAAAKLLHGSLAAGLRLKYDKINAHKYLAFVDCVSGRERQCHDEFRKVLELDPTFELGKAEAGHPIWGPVFRSVKDGK